jgi:hypothetical protein
MQNPDYFAQTSNVAKNTLKSKRSFSLKLRFLRPEIIAFSAFFPARLCHIGARKNFGNG